MFRTIYPDRWFVWTVIASVATGVLLLFAINLYAIDIQYNADSYDAQFLDTFNRLHKKHAEVSSGFDTSNWLTYRNEKYGFEFKYPSDWTTNGSTDIFWLASPERRSFFNDIDEGGDISTDDIGVKIIPAQNYRDFSSFTALYENGWYKNYAVTSPTLIAKKIAYRFSVNDGETKPSETVFVYTGSFYVGFILSDRGFSVSGQTIPDHLFTFNQILSTLKFFEPVVQIEAPKADISNWKTYRNEKYGIEVKFPPHLEVGFTGPAVPAQIARFSIYDPNFDTSDKVGQQIRTGMEAVDFVIYPYTSESFIQMTEENKNPQSAWDINPLREKIISSPSGDISIYYHHSALIGADYPEGYFHNQKYAFQVSEVFHDKLGEGVISTIKLFNPTQ